MRERTIKMMLKRGWLFDDLESHSGYWLVTQICGKPTRLFAGGSRDKADRTFNHYAKRED